MPRRCFTGFCGLKLNGGKSISKGCGIVTFQAFLIYITFLRSKKPGRDTGKGCRLPARPKPLIPPMKSPSMPRAWPSGRSILKHVRWINSGWRVNENDDKDR